MTDLLLSDLRLVGLTLDEFGPFQGGGQTFTFMGDTPALESSNASPGPSSLYMLLGRNGRGKTTVLEAIHGLFGLLANPSTGRFADWTAPGRAQLDMRITWTIDGATSTVLLSIWTGQPGPLSDWDEERLEDEAQATDWAKLGLMRGPLGSQPTEGSNEIGLILYRAIREAAGHAPAQVFGSGPDLPTVLYFPADRMLVPSRQRRTVEAPDNWIYQPAHRFGADGADWNNSLENLLVWLSWLGEGQLEQVLEFVNLNLFDEGKSMRPPRRREVAAYVSSEGQEHGLEGLSHGERALLQIYLRTVAHMSRNTVILIDEVELHLHTTWVNRMFQVLKALLRSMPTLSIVFTTHDRELVRVFDHRTPERGIVKGGYLITEDIS